MILNSSVSPIHAVYEIRTAFPQTVIILCSHFFYNSLELELGSRVNYISLHVSDPTVTFEGIQVRSLMVVPSEELKGHDTRLFFNKTVVPSALSFLTNDPLLKEFK